METTQSKLVNEAYKKMYGSKTKTVINENYGKELDNLQKAFDKVVKNMSGSSVGSPLDIWIDLGMRNQLCDKIGNVLNKAKQ